MKVFITGIAGFIASHLADALVLAGHEVLGVDDLSTGRKENLNPGATFLYGDIAGMTPEILKGMEVVVHCAAIARTPWTIDRPSLTAKVNVLGTQHLLECARVAEVPRVILCSSNVVYAAYTPYRASKEMMEMWGRCYVETYGMSVLSLRFSNVYGTRQREDGPSPNVFAALRRSKRENGYVEITGDGEQTRDFTHVSDIVRGIIAAMGVAYRDEAIDLCTGINTTLNQVAWFFGCPVHYLPERRGDVRYIVQSPARANNLLNWQATVALPEGIKDCLS